ncbi:hypothetical protein JHC09_09610 [Devosia sp. MC532]|uniref:hypothetical protein n=1 Tax=Devosia sp. MC532 TaxID=2799788 RepID=UPI0018F7396B|nr:hypothetical protein [Devosia sp. MC532]MBJ7578143.1 hypothetical protein [Devosia sp. MC532]
MTPEEAREIDRLEFEADCRAARERAYAHIAMRRNQPPVQSMVPTPRSTDAVVLRRSSARLYSLDGKRRTLEEWSVLCGHSVAVLRYRMKNGMTFEQAVTTPKLRHSIPWQLQVKPAAGPGVVDNFAVPSGTGGGSVTQDISQIEFLQ